MTTDTPHGSHASVTAHPLEEPDPLWGHPLVIASNRAVQRLRAADRRRPWVLDTAVVIAAFLLFGVADLVHDGDRHEAALKFTRLPVAGVLALQAGLVLPLLWRRRRPSATFTAVLAVFLIQWLLGAWLRADVALLIALYSLALHGRLRHLPWACAAMAGALALVAVRLSETVAVGDALFFLFNAVVAALALGLAVRIRRSQLAVLRERAARLEIERDQRSKLAAAEERTRVAREMHDIVGHNLSVMITLADGGAYAALIAPERGKEALELIGETGRQALGELRRMLGVLRERTDAPEFSPQPGIAEVDALCDRIRTAGPTVRYRTVGELDALDRGVQLTAYRIVQEALTNSLKHAGSDTRIHLLLSIHDAQLRIGVEDTGPPSGTKRPTPVNQEGHGLAGMAERAALYGGSVSAGPRSGGGWTVHATLDLTPLAGSPGGTP
ncbi:histidine kinase [Streptomyces sp. SPB162]|uniref:sensor histidine kinase n=1 Tax=Streptomyces sp. SPB162 TaxID=2940560 RepID=UPI00240503C8|nr:histidine kinase [Streptomyces sp. SPB162]MDF9817032.1 signal transduction histidine kinase [Streptomyces sp. SPB162]